MKRGWRRALGASLLAAVAWSAGGLSAAAGPSVPTFNQRSLQWSRDALGSDPVDTIGSAGCALTAVTMVTAAYGYATNPQRLNRWLTAHGGYIENDLLLWRQAGAATQGAVRWKWLHIPGIVSQLKTDAQDIEDLPPQSLVEAQLDAGRLVVAEVRLSGHMHFVVITGHSGGGILYINDPWYGDRTTLQARYGTYRQAVHSAQVFYRS
jgi:Peptidase_C39 like family